ncbi:hypothetical protein SO802_027526 [Lithocarpus litseifolius]|uniref:Reverse transcriptase domain-containing protein n=1 Tax=Lithocarpus litseifolius TaxID=425828 RepID=A0AAW2C2W3_9ROSI
MEFVMNSLGFRFRQVIEAKGFAGGLCMMWRDNDIVEVLEYNKNLIAVQVSDKLCKWVLVGFYRPTYPAKKAKAWGNLSALLESFTCPWICMGDFNYTLYQDERAGGSKCSSSAVNHLKDLMFEFEAIDLGSSGNNFTWAKGKWGSVETLSRIIDHQLAIKNLDGVKASINAPAITHVMYADDIVLFSKATKRNATTIVKCIEKYCKWSGQSLNKAKSGVFFSKHTLLQSQRSIKHILKIKKLKHDAVYLGAPFCLSKSPSKDFKFLVDKLESKLTSWRSKTLSRAGRTTLIKSVAQAIPNYPMSSFKIPSGVCDKLDTLSRRFWWKPKSQNGHFLALTAWDNICKPTCKGGLGFRKAKEFNDALLAKLAWMIG